MDNELLVQRRVKCRQLVIIWTYHNTLQTFGINRTTMILRWPEPIYMRVGYVFDLRLQNERFNRFLWFLASIINNNETLRKCYLFSCRYKNLCDIGIYLKPYFYEKCKELRNPTTNFSLTSANKPQNSLVLHLQVWRQSWS